MLKQKQNLMSSLDIMYFKQIYRKEDNNYYHPTLLQYELDKIIGDHIPKMNENRADKLFTNSCIQLSIPFQYQQYGGITCYWTSAPKSNSKTSDLFQFLTTKQRSPKDFQRTYYLCTPLDIGSMIGVKVKQERPLESIILEDLKYGMVQAEDNLVQTVQNPKYNRVQVLLNKNIKKQGTIHIVQQKGPSSFAILISMGSLQLKLPINDRIAKTQLQTFQKFPYFKIYQSQPNTVGLLISYLMPYLMQKLRELNIYYHFGNYLKVYFQNRGCRDLFMLHLISYAESGIQSLRNLKQAVHMAENSRNKKLKNQASQGQAQKGNPRQLLKIPKIQSTIRASQIMSGLRSAEEGQSEQEIIQEDILQDIYNILYTPANKIGKQSGKINNNNTDNKQEVKNVHSFDNNFLNLGKIVEAEKCQKSIEIYESQQLQCPKQQPANSSNNFKFKHNQTQFSQNILTNNSDEPPILRQTQYSTNMRYPIKKYKTVQYELPNHNKESSKQLYGVQKPNLQSKFRNEKINDFTKQMKEIDLLEKINQLFRKNQALMLQNMNLKTENQKLKAAKNKSEKTKETNKMIQIKAMVQMMAHKLQELQSTKNGIDQKNWRQQNNTEEIERKRIQEQNQQSKKRVWSPRTHHQLIKNIKQKHHEQKNLHRQQSDLQLNITKKKSFSNEEAEYKDEPKYNFGSMKQCVTFGKSNGYIFNIQQSEQVKAKTDLSQTVELRQVGKKNKEMLYTSIKDLQVNDHNKNGQKRQGISQASTSQPTFRNVFG